MRRGALVAALLLATWSARTALAASPQMPAPSYENTFYGFVYDAPLWSDEHYAASRDALLARATGGPYARIGFTTYYAIDLPWSADLTTPLLTSPPRVLLEDILERLAGDGLTYHVSAMLGMSRFYWIYEDAKREDRRNAQWFLDNEIVPVGFVQRAYWAREAWVTPSRYARKLRRHMEAKTRAFAAMFAELRAQHPETLISASGDAEAELSEMRVVRGLPLDAQIIADYSPFAVLEFRDWILRTGLYALGAQYSGQGYKRKKKDDFAQGAGALTAENLARFNATFGTSFTSWNLQHFHWSLDDPIDGDPNAIRFAKYKKRKFVALPTSGAKHVAGGFDAPRGPTDPTKKFWKLWLKFREQMVANFARDVATWMTTTPGGAGEPALPPDRWYTHQIPADYLNGREPGVQPPSVRLRTSASTLATAFIPATLGSPGLTILDRFELYPSGPPGGYNRTSAFALGAVEARAHRNWGIPEYAPSWHIDVAPETDVARIAAQWHRVHGAGAHMVAYTPWPHFTGSANGDAFGVFMDDVGDAPRASRYVPASPDPFVEQLYVDLFDRLPTPVERAARVTAIDDGSVPRPRLVANLVSSSDVQQSFAGIVRIYLGLLGRQPTRAELRAHAAYVRGGSCSRACRQQRRREIVAQLAATAEYQARFGGANTTAEEFVQAMFQGVLHRAPTDVELSVYLGFLNATPPLITRLQFAQGIVDWPEHVTRTDAATTVILTYLTTLGRLPESDELADWSGRVTSGLSRRGLAQTFLLSPEYAARFVG